MVIVNLKKIKLQQKELLPVVYGKFCKKVFGIRLSPRGAEWLTARQEQG